MGTVTLLCPEQISKGKGNTLERRGEERMCYPEIHNSQSVAKMREGALGDPAAAVTSVPGRGDVGK